LFSNTQIPCALWFLSKNRGAGHKFRARKDEILFIDGRKLGTLISGSRKQKQLSPEEIERIAAVYRQFKYDRVPDAVPGFCAVAKIDNVREYNYALTPGRYVGASDDGEEDAPFEERYPQLRSKLMAELEEGRTLTAEIAHSLESLANV
jgi:type I restriction enzyme M protein